MVVLIIDSRMTDPFLRTEACFVVTLFLSWLGDDCWIGLRCSALNPLYELFHTITIYLTGIIHGIIAFVNLRTVLTL